MVNRADKTSKYCDICNNGVAYKGNFGLGVHKTRTHGNSSHKKKDAASQYAAITDWRGGKLKDLIHRTLADRPQGMALQDLARSLQSAGYRSDKQVNEITGHITASMTRDTDITRIATGVYQLSGGPALQTETVTTEETEISLEATLVRNAHLEQTNIALKKAVMAFING